MAGLILGACQALQKGDSAPDFPPSPSHSAVDNIQTPPSTLGQVLTVPGLATPTLNKAPFPVSTPSATPSVIESPQAVKFQQASLLAQVVVSDVWQELGLSTARRAAWEAYTRLESDLPDSELLLVGIFLEQYSALTQLAAQQIIPSNSILAYRVREFEDAAGESHLALYAFDEKSSLQDGAQRLFMVAYDRKEQARALLLSPRIEGLSQRISADGKFVEYLTPDGEWLVKADARLLDPNKDFDSTIIEFLLEENLDPVYVNASAFPRYRLNLPSIESGFFAVEKLTLSQMRLMISTLELFERDDLAQLKPLVFLPVNEVAYIITRDARPFAAAAALALGESPREAIVLLFTKILFDNRYDTAAAISHEAAHIWQGKSEGCVHPEKMLHDEIGNKNIPSDFYDWSGEQLFQAVKEGDIGAYHVSLWVLFKFNQLDKVEWSRRVIETGTNNGQSLLLCK